MRLKMALLGLILACTEVRGGNADPISNGSSVWSFDSNAQNIPVRTIQQKEARDVYSVIKQSVTIWNAHDVVDYVRLFFWHSSDLVFVDEGRQINGWNALNALFTKAYKRDPSLMGELHLKHLKIQMLDNDEALVISSWTSVIKQSKKYDCSDACIIRDFPDGWKIVAEHSCLVDEDN
jgi:hypothetical protein